MIVELAAGLHLRTSRKAKAQDSRESEMKGWAIQAAIGVAKWMGLSAVAHAQHASLWQGEWGAFADRGAQEGRRLSIYGCMNASCMFSIEARSKAGHTEATSQSLTIVSDTEAVAALPGETSDAVCRLHFERQAGTTPNIAVQARGDTCTSYYSTSPAVTMSGDYPFRSAINYGGIHADECFLDDSASRMATCMRPDVSALEQKWQELAGGYPLQPPTSRSQSTYEHVKEMDDAILNSCDRDADAAKCLTTRYTSEITTMQVKKDAYLDGTIERGDPAEGGRMAAKIAGQYRHSFPNGDVQGDKFTSTDTLTIRPVGAASIHFEVELNFYNGHECSLSGGALYRKDGSFVFDDSARNALANTPACRLAIIPTGEGVRFQDITGGCKLNYCGERGGWDGEGFTFKERIRPPVSATKNER